MIDHHPTEKPELFLISPIGDHDSEVRKRADSIRQHIREAVGDRFEVLRADDLTEQLVGQSMLKHLATAPMAIAYLGEGEEYWNPNVMFEVGYRLALQRPLLIVMHRNSSSTQKEIPFDIALFRRLEVMPERELDTNETAKKKLHEELWNEVDALYTKSKMKSSYAVVDIVIPLDGENYFLSSSVEADRMFHVDCLRGKSVASVFGNLEKMIVPEQWEAVANEQYALLGRLVNSSEKDMSGITSQVPLIFRSGEVAGMDELNINPDYQGSAVAALIAQHRIEAGAIILRMLYYKLANAPKKSGNHFVCGDDAIPTWDGGSPAVDAVI